ncbi:MAG TPA: VOC family protein [Vicinamibacterales bacterium]|nr:VOC family protein [Vicinamibacterales bacterium]
MTLSRRQLLQTLGIAAAAAPLNAFAQGRCMTTFGVPSCNTTDIAAVFAPTLWKTIALEKITFNCVDPQKEAAFYIALMGWTLRSADDNQATLDIGDWGSAVFKKAPADGQTKVSVESVSWVIDNWNAKRVEQELTKRNLSPRADNGANGFESFWVKDPDGWPVQICNNKGLASARKSPTTAKSTEPQPFAPTGWKTVWLDHLSFNVTNYKQSASFYTNLLGWTPTYDEGSQNELMIGDVGDIIVRGGNPLDPEFGKAPRRRGVGVDHISFGIQPWDTDGVKNELEKRGLRAQIDTSSRHRGPDGSWVPDEIHTAEFKSYHTATPNGYNLQISYVTHDKRLSLANAVNPKRISGK